MYSNQSPYISIRTNLETPVHVGTVGFTPLTLASLGGATQQVFKEIVCSLSLFPFSPVLSSSCKSYGSAFLPSGFPHHTACLPSMVLVIGGLDHLFQMTGQLQQNNHKNTMCQMTYARHITKTNQKAHQSQHPSQIIAICIMKVSKVASVPLL